MNVADQIAEHIQKMKTHEAGRKAAQEHLAEHSHRLISELETLLDNNAKELTNVGGEPMVPLSRVLADFADIMAIIAGAKSDREASRQKPAIVAPTVKATPTKPRAIGKVKLTDDQLFGALYPTYQTPGDIVDELAHAGITVSKPLIYARMPKLMETRPGLIEANGHSYRLKKPLTKPVRAASNVIDFMPTTKPNKVEERFHPVTTKQTKPTKTPPKKKPNPFAALSKLAASVLTNRFKTRDQIANDVRGHGWKGSLALLGPVLNSLVNLGAAEEIDGRYRRA